MAVAEALAHGLPVVSTPTGAHRRAGRRRCRPAGAAWGRGGAGRRAVVRARRSRAFASNSPAARGAYAIGCRRWDAAFDKMAAALERVTLEWIRLSRLAGAARARRRGGAVGAADARDCRRAPARPSVARARSCHRHRVEYALSGGPPAGPATLAARRPRRRTPRGVAGADGGVGGARAYDVAVETGGWVIRGDGLRCHVAEPRRLDLGALADGTIFSGRHLVTASALLDLVSEPWLRALADGVARMGRRRCSRSPTTANPVARPSNRRTTRFGCS